MKANIVLQRNSTAGYLEKRFDAQAVDIRKQKSQTILGADGTISMAAFPTEVLWKGGRAAELEDITDVLIVGPDGATLVKGPIAHNTLPYASAAGVTFSVLEG